MSEFLLEIGSGELPYKEVSLLHDELANVLSEFFNQNTKLKEKITVESYATPRRVVALVKGLPVKGEDLEVEVIGPPLKIAYDSSSCPAVPLIQFMKKNGITNIKNIIVINQKKGAYIACKKIIKGMSIKALLSENMELIIKRLQFKKSMFWSHPDVRYPRPILWILALFDGKVVNFSIGDIHSGDTTYLLRKTQVRKTEASKSRSFGNYFKNSFVKIKTSEDYFDKLQEEGIILNNSERKIFIEKELQKVCKKIGGYLLDYNDEFMAEIVGMTEQPHAIYGSFDSKFLFLPDELLSIVMKKHQRFFPLKSKNGSLLPAFIGIANITGDNIDSHKVKNSDNTDNSADNIDSRNYIKRKKIDRERDRNIAHGYSIVLAARLNDADFFYKEDLKKTINNFTEMTKNILFHEGLGSYYDKTERVKKLGLFISQLSGFSENDKLDFEKSANLLKFDLASHIVYEFPEMQGIAGRIYAKEFGESEIISNAIEEHYYPIVLSGKKLMPSSDVSALCSIADKFDTIFSFTMINKLPNGESDPFAIRRAMIGIIDIILEKKYILSLTKVFNFYFQNFFTERYVNLPFLSSDSDSIPKNAAIKKSVNSPKNLQELYEAFNSFAMARFKSLMSSSGYKYDEISSVVDLLSSGFQFEDIYVSFLKIDFISKFKMHEKMYELSLAFKRINNITINDSEILDFKQNIMVLPEEKQLIKSFEAVKRELNKLINQYPYYFSNYWHNFEPGKSESYRHINSNDFEKLMNSYHKIVFPLNNFFDNILVFTDDIDLRNSRIGLLNNILIELKNICDFSKLSY